MRYLTSIGWELRGGDTNDDFPYYFKKFKNYNNKYFGIGIINTLK